VEELDYWRLCEELSVIHAALLIAGCNPTSDFADVEDLELQKRRNAYEAAKTALSHAVRSGRLPATIRNEIAEQWDHYIECYVHVEGDSPDLAQTTILVTDLREWLMSRGIRSGFFFPDVADAPDYLDRRHPRYAPKLAAAVKAWLAVAVPNGKHPKQALAKWLRQHAADFDLADEEGKPNETGIEEIAKVANWQPTGGAPRTPGD
jgi:hypothetical protein